MTLLPEAGRDAALAAARAAAAILRGARPNAVRSKTSPRDLVTEWDVRAEQTIAATLAQHAPGVPMLGEEEGARGTGESRFIVDPIDGTVNFVHGLPFYGVSIAYEVAGVVQAGVVLAPALGWEFTAVRGQGAFLRGASAPSSGEAGQGERLHVSRVMTLADALLATGFPPKREHSIESNIPEFVHLKRHATAVRRVGSASLDLSMVAAGWFDGHWERWLKPWDVAAGFLLVEEAGGRVSDSQGKPARVDGGDFVASNGLVHDALLAALAAVPPLAPW